MLRVLVSSVVDGFEEYREAARRGVTAAGANPLLVNEDFPSLATSSRNACLDAIESVDYLASIVGQRGGWTTPSGLLVVEEEFEHAKRHNIPVIAFVQDITRDADAERFVRKLSDYVTGSFRTTFRSPQELEREVERSFRERVERMAPRAAGERDLSEYFASENRQEHALLRFVLVPERTEEVLDPVRLASPGFQRRLFEIGHGGDVGLFSYTRPKSVEIEGVELTIEQTEAPARHGHEEYVRLQVGESGSMVIDANVTGRRARGRHDSMLDSWVVALEDIEEVLAACFRFSTAWYGEIDPYLRHETFHYNVGLLGLGHRILERNPQPRSAGGISLRGSGPVIAFPGSRALSRPALGQPDAEIKRAVLLLERNAGK